MDTRFQELANRIDRIAADVTASVTAAVTAAVNEHVTNVVTAAEKRLSQQAQINAEAVRDTAKAIADGYGGTLEAIDRRLEQMNRDFSTKFGDHDRVLNSHARRLSALERKRT